MGSIKLQKRMDAIFTNSEKSKTSDSHRLYLNLADKTNLQRNDTYISL